MRISQHHAIDVLSWMIPCSGGFPVHKIGTAPPNVITKKVTKRATCGEPQP